ncbi:T9SS type A sorting domain-containing protein [Neolewinella aurantiaca]|uniref:T9SS type A sorting domain-containing protein n=1 Tax=Neolewinella aurantiaca TaxID=2602767 RepID=A0A5C7FRM6_9BACT|nr:T9SS type A sorting domain-containing protein [Neolewinella aurantiaca]TXF88774.1 T9SS type A sorting domain-containing protein [Neolewinella aurantiaca]
MKLSFFPILVLCFSPLAKAQVFFPTPTHEPVWTRSELFYGPLVLYSITARDSVFHDENWLYKVEQSTTVDGDDFETRELGYYRVEGPKVFVREGLGDLYPEYLQYDFSLNAGDSVLIKGPQNFEEDEVLYRITDRDTIDCSGRNLLRLTVEFKVPFEISPTTYRSRWVESIGDIQHPFLGFDCFDLSCESRYTKQKYISTLDSLSIEDYRECQVVSSVAHDYIKEHFLLYPNPFISAAQSSLKITFPDGAGRSLKKIVILDASGREVKSLDQLSRRGELQELEVNFQPGELSPGVYLVRIIDRSGSFRTLKWVVQ